jgi:hypothetical protein
MRYKDIRARRLEEQIESEGRRKQITEEPGRGAEDEGAGPDGPQGAEASLGGAEAKSDAKAASKARKARKRGRAAFRPAAGIRAQFGPDSFLFVLEKDEAIGRRSPALDFCHPFAQSRLVIAFIS